MTHACMRFLSLQAPQLHCFPHCVLDSFNIRKQLYLSLKENDKLHSIPLNKSIGLCFYSLFLVNISVVCRSLLLQTMLQ